MRRSANDIDSPIETPRIRAGDTLEITQNNDKKYILTWQRPTGQGLKIGVSLKGGGDGDAKVAK